MTLESLGLPKFGVEVLAMTSGRLTFYGPAVEPWALLEETAYAGTNQLKFRGDLKNQGWKDNSNIVIAGLDMVRPKWAVEWMKRYL